MTQLPKQAADMHRLDKHSRQTLGAEAMDAMDPRTCGQLGAEGTAGRSDTTGSVQGSKGAFIKNVNYSSSYEDYLIWGVNLSKNQNTVFSI